VLPRFLAEFRGGSERGRGRERHGKMEGKGRDDTTPSDFNTCNGHTYNLLL